jgi:hypothetical protein
VNQADAHGAYAQEIRRFLASSSDVAVLAATAEALGTRGRTLYEKHMIDFDAGALARTYLDKAEKLDPRSPVVQQSEENIRFWTSAGSSPTGREKGTGGAARSKQ